MTDSPPNGGPEDTALLRLDDLVAEIDAQIDNVNRGCGELDDIFGGYATFYEQAEQIIVQLLGSHGTDIDSQRRSDCQHRYHAAVLEALANDDNPLHSSLRSDLAYDGLRHAKYFRNEFRKGTCDEDILLHAIEISKLKDRIKAVTFALRASCNQAGIAFRNDASASTIRALLRKSSATDKERNQVHEIRYLPQLSIWRTRLSKALGAMDGPLLFPWLDLRNYCLPMAVSKADSIRKKKLERENKKLNDRLESSEIDADVLRRENRELASQLVRNKPINVYAKSLVDKVHSLTTEKVALQTQIDQLRAIKARSMGQCDHLRSKLAAEMSAIAAARKKSDRLFHVLRFGLTIEASAHRAAQAQNESTAQDPDDLREQIESSRSFGAKAICI